MSAVKNDTIQNHFTTIEKEEMLARLSNSRLQCHLFSTAETNVHEKKHVVHLITQLGCISFCSFVNIALVFDKDDRKGLIA